MVTCLVKLMPANGDNSIFNLKCHCIYITYCIYNTLYSEYLTPTPNAAMDLLNFSEKLHRESGNSWRSAATHRVAEQHSG